MVPRLAGPQDSRASGGPARDQNSMMFGQMHEPQTSHMMAFR
jgi:hypothetical protein